MIEMLDKDELLAMLHKQCTKCKKIKYFGEFCRQKSCSCGVSSLCRVCNRERIRRWKEANPEKHREHCRRWKEANPEKCREHVRRWRKNNPEKDRENVRRWQKANPERVRERTRRWRKDNPEKHRENRHRRRARKANAAGSFSADQVQARFDYYGNRCIYCGCDGKLTIEHLIPLARGGTNWPANLAPSCGSCNSSKGTKTHFEYVSQLEEKSK